MAYDATKDIILKSWDNKNGLQAGLHQYNEGEKKFQVGPRSYIKKNGEISVMKAGRLNLDEMIWLQNVITEAVTLMAETNLDNNVNDE